ncbi:MAG TPA: sulfatase [Bacteroidales bacterium]|jgi:arylsulfatase A-like enzyme|nr:sulfatase [Bacteroidales bacterium]
MRYSKQFMAALSIALLLIGCKNSPQDNTAERPNIIFIMSDDHAYQALSAYESSLIKTPNLDKLARQGMRFDRAFVSNSICSPSRAVALTGKFSHLNSVKDNLDIFDSTQVTFPKILQQNGYETAIVGKWHLKSEPTGFDFWKVLPDQGDYYQPDFRTANGMVTEQGYVTDVITDIAIEYLDEQRDNSKPFLLMYHHKAPHREWMPAMEYLDAYHDEKIAEPVSLFDTYENRGAAAREAEMRISDHMGLSNDNKIDPKNLTSEEFMGWYTWAYEKNIKRLTSQEAEKWEAVYGPINRDFVEKDLKGDELTRWKYQRYMQDYLATILSIDDNIGRLLDYLDSSGLAENTLIVYTSDQGFYLGEHGWFDKRFMYEESFRTPLIVRWPGKVKPQTVNTDLVQNIDFAPTFLSAAGIQPPEEMQGQSILPLLKGEEVAWRDALYYHYYEYPGIHAVKRHYGIRTDRYKLIHFYYDIDEWELYDLESDPAEMKNVYDETEYAAIKAQLHIKLNELREQYGDSDDLALEMLDADLERLKAKEEEGN